MQTSPANKDTAKHTPGPWRGNGSAIESDPADGFSALIAHVYHPDENGADEWQGNRAIISAAPDLLAALRNLVTYASDWFEANDVDLAAARAAIAKAEGREP